MDVSGGGEKKPVYENGCKLNLMVLGGGEQNIMLIDYTFLPLISYTHNGDDTP